MEQVLDAEHIRLTHLATILGNAELLRRRIARSPSLAASEGEDLVRVITAIEQAARALLLLPPDASSHTSDDA